VCSYDAFGVGQSDHVQGDHSIDEVAENMHDLFHSAQVPGPYVLVAISAGGILVRHYEEHYPADVAGFVFVDSSHEEMVWRDAAISPAVPGSDMDLKSLQRGGLLPPQQHLTWHDDVPIIVLERGERAPCSAFPGLTQTQCDQINEAWHSFQVDLSHRSKYAELRQVAGSGHAMHQQKPKSNRSGHSRCFGGSEAAETITIARKLIFPSERREISKLRVTPGSPSIRK
jgi:pimeloyl-ACP methyl ester carboxylesterase